jgi:hypothetical protein
MTPQLSSLPTSFLRLFITDKAAEKSVIYGRRGTRFIEGKKANFDVGLNCTTHQNELEEIMGSTDLGAPLVDKRLVSAVAFWT